MKFSVTIPAYKRFYLDDAISSVLSQTYSDWELIIVDDFSPEDLFSVVEPYLSDARVRYYRNATNCGAVDLVDNWNKCLDYCTGDYVICIGDDDRLLPCCLEQYAQLIQRYPQLHVYHCRTQIINESGDVTDVQELRPQYESALSLIWNRWATRDKQYIGDFCYDVRHLKASGGYYKLPLAWGSDDITAVRAASELGIANTEQFCFQYRVNSMTISNSGNALVKMDAMVAYHKWFCDFIDKKGRAELSAADAEYLRTIGPPRSLYYYRALGQNCVDAMKGNPFRIAVCVRKLRVFNYSSYTFLRFYITSLKNRILGIKKK